MTNNNLKWAYEKNNDVHAMKETYFIAAFTLEDDMIESQKNCITEMMFACLHMNISEIKRG